MGSLEQTPEPRTGRFTGVFSGKPGDKGTQTRREPSRKRAGSRRENIFAIARWWPKTRSGFSQF